MIEYGYRESVGPRGKRYFQAYIGDMPVGNPCSSLEEVLSHIEHLKSMQAEPDMAEPESEHNDGPGF